MTTILHLPEELLSLIFKELLSSSQKECQYVCKSWYSPAHKLVLKRISIKFSNIQQFISSIDCNPDPAYLGAVERIHLTERHPGFLQEHCLLDKELIEKLFYRFPNLKDVVITADPSVFTEFNDEICETILNTCRKLNKFEIHSELEPSYYVGEDIFRESQSLYLDVHFKLRLLLTNIDLSDVDFSMRPESSIDYVSKFPRLKNIYVPDANKFQKLLPVFLRLSNLKSIEMQNMIDDQEAFAESYIDTRSKEEQEQMVKSLSLVKDLTLKYRETFGVNSVNFITKYLTGLDYFMMLCYNNQTLTHLQQILLSSTVVDLVCTAKNKGEAYLANLKLTDLPRYLPGTISKLFHNMSSSNMTKALQVNIQRVDTGSELVHLSVQSDSMDSLRKITIDVSSQFRLRDITTMLSPTDDIDNFILDIDYFRQEYTQEISASQYDEILTKMASLKEVTLEIPPSYIQDSSTMVYPLIERVTLQATAGDRSQEILDEFSNKFPNLKQLSIYYFCGIWNKEFQEYQVSLQRYSLDRLLLDLTTVFERMKNKRDDMFIVVKVLLTSTNEELFYKVPLYLRDQQTRINKSDLDGLKSKDDYYCVHVTINNFQRLDIYMCYSLSRFEPKYARNRHRPLVTLLND